METIVKIIIGFGLGIAFSGYLRESPEPEVVTHYVEKSCPPVITPKCENCETWQRAFNSCQEFLQDSIEKLKKYADDMVWEHNQVLNCQDELRFYRRDSTSAYSD